MKKFLVLIVAVSLLAVSAVAAPQFTSAPENPEFSVFSSESVMTTESGYALGYRAPPFIVIPPDQDDPSINTEALPAQYTTSSAGKITPVKDQSTCGSCWAFATMGSLEGIIATSTFKPDYSENYLKNFHGFDWGVCGGGNAYMSMAMFGRWQGPLLESTDPYQPYDETAGIEAAVRHVQNVHVLPTTASGSAAVKKAIKNIGPVYTRYYHNDAYFNSATNSYWFKGASDTNHCVTIVGWNDNYDRTKFNKIGGVYPPANGAWKVKNSWGKSWGNNGYFWVSYYDSKFAKSTNAVFLSESKTNYKKVYYYDTLGWVSSIGSGSNTAWLANAFKSEEKQKIRAFSIYTPVYDSQYTVYFYKKVVGDNPRSGVFLGSQSGTIHYPGFHTVTLTTPYPIRAKQRFSVVVRLTTPGDNYPIAIEDRAGGYTTAAYSKWHHGYVSTDGTSWTDIKTAFNPTADVCLKVYTK